MRGMNIKTREHKIFSNIFYEGHQPHMENNVGKCQCRFGNGKSTIDQIQSIRQILKKTSEYGINMFRLFVDLKTAYDTIRRINYTTH